MFDLRSRTGAPAIYLVMRTVIAFASSLMFTVLALMYIQVARMDPLQLVLVGTALELAYFIFEVPTGALADTYSRRFSIILGTAIVGCTFIGTGLLPFFAAIIVFEVARGIGEAFMSGAVDAWIAGEIGDEAIGPLFIRSHQLAQAAALVAIVASVALGSIDLRLPVLVGGSLYVGLAAMLMLAMPERGFTRVPRSERSWAQLAATTRDGAAAVRGRPVLLSIAAIAFFAGAASEGKDRLEEAHFVIDLGLPVELSAVMWLGTIAFGGRLIGIIAVQAMRRWLLRRLTDDTWMARFLAALQAAHVASQLIFAWAPGFAVGLAAVWGQALLTSGGLMSAWTIRQVDPAVRATVLSMNGTLNAVGQVAGGPPVGLVGSTLGIRAALTASALLLLPTVALFYRASRAPRPASIDARAETPA